jgi:hypothetical protein
MGAARALIFFHHKGSVPVCDTEKFRQFFDSGYDLVIASRNIKGGRNEEDGTLIKHRKRMEFPTIETKRLAGTSNFKALPTGWKRIKYFPRESFARIDRS